MTRLVLPLRPQPAAGVGVSSSFGTFGELIQGRDDRGVDFLVTLPIAVWSTAAFTVTPGTDQLTVWPPHKHKAVQVARAMLASCGAREGGAITIDSAIPEGKGLASSSADLVATARAVAAARGVMLPPEQLETLLREIEPSDGVMYDAVTVFDHRQVTLRARLGSLPAMTVVSLDEGGVVDTVAFNRRKRPYPPGASREYARLLADLERAVPAGDLATVGRAATRSAELNQEILPKRHLAELRRAAVEIGALGVTIAHSGTVAGLLLDDADPDYARKWAAAWRTCLRLAGNAAVYHTLRFPAPPASPVT